MRTANPAAIYPEYPDEPKALRRRIVKECAWIFRGGRFSFVAVLADGTMFVQGSLQRKEES